MGVGSSSESGVAHPSIGASGGVAADKLPVAALAPPHAALQLAARVLLRGSEAALLALRHRRRRRARRRARGAARRDDGGGEAHRLVGGMRRAWACCASRHDFEK